MAKSAFLAALLASGIATPALAADEPAPDVAAEVAAMREEIAELRAEVAELKASRESAAATPPPAPAAATQAAAAAPIWKGAPQLEDKRSGFSFKPKGLAQFDAGFVGTPGPELSGTVGGLNYNNLGWNSRARRLVIGAEGSLPGGFGYNVEFNFAQGTVDYEDIVLTYQRSKSPIKVTIGNFYPLSSLETMTSSRLTSFLERASFTDAFNYNRRLGIALALLDPEDDRYTLTAGLFGQEINNAAFNRTGWQASVRGTFAPTLGDARLHLGANFQHRVAQRDAQNLQYRARPFTQVTDQRFVDTGLVAADGDDIAGLEFGAILKSFHVAAEAQQLWVRGYRPGRRFGANNGAAGGLFYAGDPNFRSAYAEVGYYFTGESRGYKGGRWDRPKVLHPFDDGGWGALQLNARLDWLDLGDRVGSGGSTLAAPDYVNGGEQLGYELSLIWNPTDYLRFQAQYARASFEGGPRAATVVPGSSEPINLRRFSVDTMALRAQVDF
ncbi:MAG: phosphate-selective porin OprO and OprP [Sphingomonadales bacterium]|jgi:phosphate-selective porin OprO/OprP|nr:phosphate-selective porin OprO and OprP [Sphingomonadales bacterium]